jgi:hypothetical protein
VPGFKDWYDLYSTLYNLNKDPLDLRHAYDYEAAYESGARPEITGHFPSRFKGMAHPRRFIKGIDTATGEKATGKDLVRNVKLQLLLEELFRRE